MKQELVVRFEVRDAMPIANAPGVTQIRVALQSKGFGALRLVGVDALGMGSECVCLSLEPDVEFLLVFARATQSSRRWPTTRLADTRVRLPQRFVEPLKVARKNRQFRRFKSLQVSRRTGGLQTRGSEMLMTCSRNSVVEILDSESRLRVAKYIRQERVDLVLGQKYQVLGVEIRDGMPWVFVCVDDGDGYPVAFPVVFFQESRFEVPNGWVLCWGGDCVQIVPQWWAAWPNFLKRLVDGDAAVARAFRAGREAEATV